MYILKTLQEENVHNNSLMGLKVFFFSKIKKIWCANSHTGVRKKKTGSHQIFFLRYRARAIVF